MRAPDYSALFEEALEAGRKRDYARAVELLTRIVGSTDRFPQALLYLGRAYHALGEYSRAAQALNFYVRGQARLHCRVTSSSDGSTSPWRSIPRPSAT